MKKKSKLITIVLAVALVINTLVGCGSKENAEKSNTTENVAQEQKVEETEDNTLEKNLGETVKIRVRFPTFPDTASLFVAWQEGFFEEVFKDDNVEVVPLDFPNGPAMNEAFLAGELDLQEKEL